MRASGSNSNASSDRAVEIRSRSKVFEHSTGGFNSMKKYMLITLMILAVAGFASAQIQPPTSDVLGAHLNYGRGCAGCHAPHSGAWGNGANKSGDTHAGTDALWGQDVGNLYGKTITLAW